MLPVSDDDRTTRMLVDQTLWQAAAQEDTHEALEIERRRIAGLLREKVVVPLNLILAQTAAYEQTMDQPQVRMVTSVLSTLVRQALQQTRDLEAGLYPAVLEMLGLEAALETLASQELRTRGVVVSLALQRLRERLPPMIEMALYRATQDAIDAAAGPGCASTIIIRLETSASQIDYVITDNGKASAGDILRGARQRIEVTGGTLTLHPVRSGGTEVLIQYRLQPHAELTERELDIIRQVAQGKSNREMAAQLRLSPRTVKFHLDNIYSKLNVNTRTQAAIYALRHGLIARNPD